MLSSIQSAAVGAGLAFALTCSSQAAADDVDDRTERLRAVAASHYAGVDRPGAAVLVYQDGEILLDKGFGMASLETDTPMTPQHRFRTASLTKQMSAALVLSLVEDGVLDLDADITTYLPDFNAHGRVFTLRQLLGHTAGLYNYTDHDDHEAIAHLNGSPEAARQFFENEPLYFEPMEGWFYSNSGYALAARIIEAVTGQSFAEAMQAHVFGPAGMTDSTLQQIGHVEERAATDYRRNADGFYQSAATGVWGQADGEVWSTTHDLLAWYGALRDNVLFSAALKQEMFSSQTLTDGRETLYGFGLTHGRIGDLATFEHGGSVDGWRAYLIMIPETDTLVALLANTNDVFENPVAAELALIATEQRLVMPEAIEVSRADMEALAGRYRHGPTDVRTISVGPSGLRSQRNQGAVYDLLPIAPDVYVFGDDPYTRIHFDDAGLRVSYRYGMDHSATRFPEGEQE